MLLTRKQIQDKKGQIHDMAVIKVAGPNGPLVVSVPFHRYKTIDAALKSFAHALMPEIQGWDSTDPIAFFVSQLAYTEAQMYGTMRIEPVYKQLVPISYEAPAWANTIESQTYDKVGRGKRIAPNATDIPLVDAKFGRRIIEVAMGGLGYHYNIQELEESRALKRPLSDLRHQIALEAFETHMDDVALYGELNFSGLFNNASVTKAQAATGGWDDPNTSPMTILTDINTAMLAVHEATKGKDVVTHVAMPLQALNALSTRLVTGVGGTTTYVTGTTILDFIKQTCLSKTARGVDVQFIGLPAGSGTEASLYNVGTVTHAGGEGTNLSRVVYWVKDQRRVRFHIPMTLNFLAPQLERLSVVVPGCYRYAGTDVVYPQSMYYQDSVLASED